MATYDHLIDLIAACPPGAILEIGAFIGEGTKQLLQTGRKVIVVDTFKAKDDPVCGEMYRGWLNDRDQRHLFDDNTRGYSNLLVITGDSLYVQIYDKVAFTFIDGGHEPKYVISDFFLAYGLTVPGGKIVFHDYGHDLPEVTQAIDNLRGANPHLKFTPGPDFTMIVEVP